MKRYAPVTCWELIRNKREEEVVVITRMVAGNMITLGYHILFGLGKVEWQVIVDGDLHAYGEIEYAVNKFNELVSKYQGGF